ncbi:hypothetical protein PSACC_01730 [Paramicrosporidium saccamoebae]|uniref:Uncharacterized protein n=1 Tax=Paramicrosporidium saccamoebae TaxID=1246581 RepID=A0A2H9TL21_9FUNG|nr:hypothetical protein PSACC_01730 [Paramicrosporidium saccamoebae]
MPMMRRVYATRLAEGQRLLTLDDFREECFYDLSFKDTSNFGRNAGMLIFTEPSESDRCRKWFVECAILLRRYSTAKDKELVDIVRYVWQESVMSPEVCYKFTLDAVQRLKGKYKEMLCQALHEKHPDNLWLKTHLPQSSGMDENVFSSNRDPLLGPVAKTKVSGH